MILDVDMKLSPWPGCDYTLESVSDLDAQINIIDIFEKEPKSREGCNMSIVHLTTPSPLIDTWTVSGFNNDDVFNTVELDDEHTDLTHVQSFFAQKPLTGLF